MADAIVDRLLAASLQANNTVYQVVGDEWSVLRSWVKSPHTISTMVGTAEVKYLDLAAVQTAAQGAEDGFQEYVYPLNTPLPQGTGVSERIGNHVQMTGVRLGIICYPTQAQGPTLMRVFVLRVPGIGTGAQYPPPSTEVFKYADNALPGSVKLLAPRRLETLKSSGQLLYDNSFTLNPASDESAMRKFLVEIDLDSKVLFRNNT